MEVGNETRKKLSEDFVVWLKESTVSELEKKLSKIGFMQTDRMDGTRDDENENEKFSAILHELDIVRRP
jgi:hypothetical protein